MLSASAATPETKGHTSELQHYEFYNVFSSPTEEELASVEVEGIESRMSAFLEDKLKKCTFTHEALVPGESMQRIVSHKVDIYNAVKTIYKNLVKEVKANPEFAIKAKEIYERVTRIAISAFYDDNSTDFEASLRKNRKNYKMLLQMFENVTIKG